MRRLMPWLVCGAVALGNGAANADIRNELFKLLPDDGAAGDGFGVSVGISGTTTIVGAHADDDNGNLSGSAYLFDTTTGRQIAKLLPNNGAECDYFGFSVGISGSTAIVGAPRETDFSLPPGSAYLFDTGTGQQLAELIPDDRATFDQFGSSVAISGATAIVGDPLDDDNGVQSGSAYLFDVTTGRQFAKLLPDDGAWFERFGYSVSIGGDTAIVGAQSHDNGTRSGSAYLFDVTTGRQIAKLLPNDGAEGDRFGDSVAISGAIAIVGCHLDDDNGYQSGSAYLFDVTTGRQIAKLLPDDGAPNDLFGHAVAISGTTAIVGAVFDDDNGDKSGSAYLFDIATGRQIAKLLPDDGAEDDLFGGSVSISLATAIVGAYGDEDHGEFSGSAYVFDASGPGDLNCDGAINGFDIEPFLLALFDPDEYAIRYPNCDINNADINGDGLIDAFDIEPFLELLFGP